MDFMIAYYPLAKFAVTLLTILAIFYAIKYKKIKTAIGIIVIYVTFMSLSPVKIDGTNTAIQHKKVVNYQNAKYAAEVLEIQDVKIETKTFAEKLAEEEALSARKNQEILDEI